MQVLRFLLPLLLLLLIGYRVRSFVRYRLLRRRLGAATPQKRRREAAAKAAPPAPGMLPADRQDTTSVFPPEPELTAALAAVAEGRWEPAAELMAGAGRDWDLRFAYLSPLADAAAEEDGWVRAWQAARPGDADAAVVAAEGLVRLAWNVRGGLTAMHTEREQFAAFHRVLVRAREACHEAAGLAVEGDPTPYAVELLVAMGLGTPHEEFRALFGEVTARAPHHQAAHTAALQYWCAKWQGSQELADAFARDAAASAAPGLLLSRLPLISWFEHHEMRTGEPGSDRDPAVLAALVEAGLADAAAAPHDSRELRALRHLLAYFLDKQGRYAEAVAQFRLVDGHLRALPWRYFGDAAAARYTAVRDRAFHEAAAAHSG